MRVTSAIGTLSVVIVLAMSAMGCDQVAKAVDANNSQGGEADGRAAELTSLNQRTADIATDDKEIFVIADNGDVLKRAAAGAGVAATRIGGYARNTSYSDPTAAILDADSLYFVDGNSVRRVKRAGGDPEKLADATPAGLAVTADAVIAVSADKTKLVKIDKATKAVTDLATGFEDLTHIVGDGEPLAVVERKTETVTLVSTKDGSKKVIAQNQSRPYRVGLGPEHVYWANGSLSDANKAVEDRIMRIKADGSGQPEMVTSLNATFTDKMVADAQFVYFGERCGGLFRAPAAGGENKKFLNAAVQDFLLSGPGVLLLEDNGCRFSDAEKNKPNRVMTVTK